MVPSDATAKELTTPFAAVIEGFQFDPPSELS